MGGTAIHAACGVWSTFECHLGEAIYIKFLGFLPVFLVFHESQKRGKMFSSRHRDGTTIQRNEKLQGLRDKGETHGHDRLEAFVCTSWFCIHQGRVSQGATGARLIGTSKLQKSGDECGTYGEDHRWQSSEDETR